MVPTALDGLTTEFGSAKTPQGWDGHWLRSGV